MPKRTQRLTAAVCAGLAISVVLGAAPGYADVGRFDDRRGETGQNIDIWGVRVDNSTTRPGRVIVSAHFDDLASPDKVAIYLDTQRHQDGPEYVFTANVGLGHKVWRTPTWQPADRRRIDNSCVRAVVNERTDSVRVAFSRSCLRFPGAVTASVRTRGFAPEAGFFTDWAPRRLRFFPWVRR